MNQNILSTSTLQSDALNGGGFGPVHQNGYGVGYNVGDKKITFMITSYGLQTLKFIEEIKSSLVEFQSALEKHEKPKKI